MTSPTATASIDIAADPATIYGIITDLSTYGDITEETRAMAWKKGSAAAPGSVFRGKNANGWRRWTTTCTVTDADAGARFAFAVTHTGIPISKWQYDIAALPDGGSRVTESTWDQRPNWYKKPAGLATGIMNRAEANTAHMEATLARLKARAES